MKITIQLSKLRKRNITKKIHIMLNYLIKYNLVLYLIKLSMLIYVDMETFSPEDILIDNLGSTYTIDRRSVSFWPSGSKICKSNSRNRVLKIKR